MLINELPDDCLLAIFDCVNNLDDLMNCYKVCVGWSQLITKRTKKVKYMLHGPDYSFDCVYYEGDTQIDGTCLSLFPNLIVAELSDRFNVKVNYKDIFALFRYHEYLKGIINHLHENQPMRKYSAKLEMISSRGIEPSIIRIGSSIKQLRIWSYNSRNDFKKSAHHFPNLERLHVTIEDSYDGPVLEKLKILEAESIRPYGLDICYVFQFMDACPNLLSAHIYSDMVYLFTGEISIHKCLQDLVIEFLRPLENLHDFKRLFMKYPNLKHLRLKMKENTKDEHIEQLIHILPNLVLLDVTECPGVTQRAADYVTDYCERYGRSIKFYFNGNIPEMDSLWPDLYIKREKIGRAFNFMKHCFLKDYFELPDFLIPIDY